MPSILTPFRSNTHATEAVFGCQETGRFGPVSRPPLEMSEGNTEALSRSTFQGWEFLRLSRLSSRAGFALLVLLLFLNSHQIPQPHRYSHQCCTDQDENMPRMTLEQRASPHSPQTSPGRAVRTIHDELTLSRRRRPLCLSMLIFCAIFTQKTSRVSGHPSTS